MTRMEMRSYYRKCAGILSLMNVWLFFMAACLAIYLSEFEGLDPEVVASASEIVINGLFVVFAMGMIWAVLYLICGIMGCVGQKEGFFQFQKVVSFVGVLLMLFSVGISVMVFINKEIDWDTEERVMAVLYIISSFLAVGFSVTAFVSSIAGRQYYDRGKKLAKDVPEDVSEDSLTNALMGIKCICASVFTIGIAFLGFYFKTMIVAFDQSYHTENGIFSMIFTCLFVIGILLTVAMLVLAVMSLRKKKEGVSFGTIVAWTGIGYHGVFFIVSLISLSQRFVKNEYPNSDYVIFSFFVLFTAIAFLAAVLRKTKLSKAL